MTSTHPKPPLIARLERLDMPQGPWPVSNEGVPLARDAVRAARALEKLLTYFGGPVEVSLKELGEDAYIEIPMQVRIGDIIEARASLDLPSPPVSTEPRSSTVEPSPHRKTK